MADYSELKSKMSTLIERKNRVENEIIKLNANYEMKVKELKEEHGISPDEIDDKKKSLENEIKELTTKITSDIEKLTNYIGALEGKLNAAKSS